MKKIDFLQDRFKSLIITNPNDYFENVERDKLTNGNIDRVWFAHRKPRIMGDTGCLANNINFRKPCTGIEMQAPEKQIIINVM